MKTKLKYLAIIVFSFGTMLQLHAQGYIVPNGVIYVGFNFLGYEFDVIQNPTNSDYTGFGLQPQSINRFKFEPIVDEGVRTFLVSEGAPISLQPILSQNYAELTYPNNYLFANGVSFYLGFYTGYNPFDSHGNYTGIYTSPVFGWGEFINNNGVIQMLDSAAEIQGGGIYAGTQTIIPVPEPNALMLGALGAILVGFRRWQK